MTSSLLAALALPVALPLLAQSVALNPQGAQSLRDLTGRVIPGFQLVSADVQSPEPMIFYGADVIAAATAAGFEIHVADLTRLNLTRTAQFNWRNTLKWAVPVVTGVGATAVGANGIKLSPDARDRVAAFAGSISLGSTALVTWESGRAPDPSALLPKVCDAGARYTTPFECLLGAKYPGGTSVVVPIRSTVQGK